MTAALTEAYYRRLYAFHDPSPVLPALPVEEFFNPNHDPRDGKFSTGPRSKKIGTGPKGGKVWTGVSADPDNRVKPKPKVHFPLEPDDYESPAEARAKFATGVYDADLGNGYTSRVAGVREIPNGIAVTIIIRKGHEQAAISTRELATDGAGRLVAHHETLYVDPKHQGKGIADRFNAHAVAEYQRLGVDRIDLHAGDTVGGYAWARQGFRIFEGDRKKFITAQLDRLDAQMKHPAPVYRPHAKKIKAESAALRKALEAGEDVQPIHLASIGEKYARGTGHDDNGNAYQTWPGKNLLIGTAWLGNYYFDANRAVTAAAYDLEHASLRNEQFYNQNHDTRDGRFTTSAVSFHRGDILRERNAILAELKTQGVDIMDPLVHIFQSSMGNRVAVVRDDDGKIVGGVQFDVSKSGRTVTVTDMRMTEKRKGHGTAAFIEIAKVAVENDYDLDLSGAVQSAKPFYSKLGAYFQKGFGHGHWTDAGRNALAAGKPIAGEFDMPYETWVNIPSGQAYDRPRKRTAQTASAFVEALACHDAACAPPPAGVGGSSPLQARRGAVPGYGTTARRDIHLAGVRVTYKPDYPDDHPDPGEVVWAKVRFQEDRNQSKDRPVLIIGRINGTDKLAAVQLTTSEGARKDRYPIGTGSWDRLGRNASVKLDQIIVVDPADYRREGSKFDRVKFDDVIGHLAAFHRTPVQIAAGATWVELYNQNHDPHSGRFSSGGGHRVITAAEARGDSRPVSHAEFQRLAKIGQAQLDQFEANRSPIAALNRNFDAIMRETYAEVQKPWGGATIDSHTGVALPQGANAYAITVKGHKQETVSVHENATEQEFADAMLTARTRFSSILQRESHYLGVFHDDVNHRIDIDPVIVVHNRADVDTIGAASHSIGGAYNFSDGNGYWPPHVAEG